MSGGQRADAVRIHAELLSHGRDLLNRDGAPIALNKLAALAGVGVGTVYRHFASSDELLEALADDVLEHLAAEARAATAEPDAWDAVARIVRAQVRLEVEHQGVREVLARDASVRDETRELKAAAAADIQSVLDRARREGVLAADVTARELVLMLCGVGYTARVSHGSGLEDRFVEIVLRGLRS